MLSMRESKENIEQRLRSEKPMLRMHKAPHGFTERVVARLPESSTIERESAPTLVLWPRLALGVAVIAIAAVFAFEFSKPTTNRLVASNQQPDAVAALTHSEPVLDASDLSIPVITPEQIQALTVKLDDPLEKELNNVISDTRQAIQFVALNFLPEK
jgi:hypothetical protein